MNNPTLSYSLRSLFVVHATLAVGIVVCQYAGLTIRQSVLISLPIGLFSASWMTLYYLARAGKQASKQQQLYLLLAIEFVLVPLASTVAIVAYFMDN